MNNPFFDLWKLQSESWRAMCDAQSVVNMRLLGMVGLWDVTAREFSQMIWEKPDALARAFFSMTTALVTGQRPDEIFRSALVPVASATHDNVIRLRKRGPHIPFSGQ